MAVENPAVYLWYSHLPSNFSWLKGEKNDLTFLSFPRRKREALTKDLCCYGYTAVLFSGYSDYKHDCINIITVFSLHKLWLHCIINQWKHGEFMRMDFSWLQNASFINVRETPNKQAGQYVVSFYPSRWESCLIFVVPLSRPVTHHNNRDAVKIRAGERWDWSCLDAKSKKQRNAVKFINCFQAKAHHPICLQSSDGAVVWNDWLDAGVWAIHQCPFKMAVWLFSNRAVLPQSQHITSEEDPVPTAASFQGDR